MASISDVNAVAERELSDIKRSWSARTKVQLPSDDELVELLTIYSASDLEECLMGVLNLIQNRDAPSTSDLLHYITCYATVHFMLGGC
jgi:hypothetical protein